MLLKVGIVWLIVSLGWFPTLEAKRKKQSGLSAFVDDVGSLLETTLDYVTGLLPGGEKSPKKKKDPISQKPKNKKKRKKPSWGSYVKSATENLNELYDTVSGSLGLFRLGKSEKDEEPEDDMAEAFFAELVAAEVVEKMTLGIIEIVSSNFDNKKK